MRCPKCQSENYYRSRSTSHRERRMRQTLPIHFYRCHECHYRAPRFTLEALKETGIRYVLALGGLIVVWQLFKVLVGTLAR